MNTRGEIRARIKRELNMVSTSTLFSDDTLNDSIGDAYLWATDRHSWPKLEKAKRTTSTTDYYYDSPDEFKSDSIFKLVINELEYDPSEFGDWLKWKAAHPTPRQDERLFAPYANQYFIHPVVAAGLEIIVWGIIQPAVLGDDESTTIFSSSESALNEGIMRKALSDLLPKESQESLNELTKAQAILDAGYARIQKRQYRYLRKDAPTFKQVNYFPGSGSPIGNFR